MKNENDFDIAIVGMAGRFPKAKNLEQFWENIRAGVEVVSRFTEEELRAVGVKDETLVDPNYVRAGTILEEADHFDAGFFGFNPREAEIMDPQHRIFLECACEALENAGYDSQRYAGLIGIFGGSGINTYRDNILANPAIIESMGGMQVVIANGNDFLTTRVSHRLNLRGPSYTVQTACSTSLVAVHIACQSLLSGDCDMALAGGVAVTFPQMRGYLHQTGSIVSPDGHCRAFDSKAKGTVSGKGVGIVVLKRLQDAVADGDCIQAIIKGSAINNDGSIKIGYTAPDIRGQSLVIRSALAAARINADTITYVEAHGTGTELGDPIEVAALTDAFKTSTDKKNFCALGSVKTNMGHADAAAGVAGLIKTVLALKHRELPPSLHFESPNPKADMANSPFYVNNRLSKWTNENSPRRAGVSSFGIGGTNAHVVLEEAPELVSGSSSRAWHLIFLSAKTPAALESATQNLAAYLKKHPEAKVADIAYTLQVGRREMECRRMVLCQNREDLLSSLEAFGRQQGQVKRVEPQFRPIAFMFTGQGSQYVGMARELYQNEMVFRREVDRCSELLLPRLGTDLRTVIYPEKGQEDVAERQLQSTAMTQPALFVIEWALAQLWISWGVKPEVLIGHSIGEYVAACLSGVFSLEDALALVAKRGQLMQSMPPGGMLAVHLSEEALLKILPQKLSLAAVNAPSLCVVSGPTVDIEEFQKVLMKSGNNGTILRTSHAFHSAMMDSILKSFTECVAKVKRNPPQIPFVSNLTGTWITVAEAMDPQYWAKHLRGAVRFSTGIKELLADDKRILLEVGPGTTLCTLARQQIAPSSPRVVFPSIRHPQEQQNDVAFVLKTLGQLWSQGITVDWSGFYAHEQRRRVPLPTYPFERQRYWIENNKTASTKADKVSLGQRKPDLADWFYVPSWKRSELPEIVEPGNKPKEKLCWLSFGNEWGFVPRLLEKLELLGHEIIRVNPGTGYAKVGDRRYTVSPGSREDYGMLLAELVRLNQVPQKILHFWGVSKPDPERWKNLEQTQNAGLYSLLFLAQALGDANITSPIEVEVVSDHVQVVTGEEMICPEKATALGACKIIPLEYFNIQCRSIDVVTPELNSEAEQKLVGQLLAEIETKQAEVIIAYRGDFRWVEAFETVQLKKREGLGQRLKLGGTYLITGGLGGVGLTLAEFLAKNLRAKLILIGRSAFLARDQWEQWLTEHDAQDPISRKIHTLRQMEAAGAEVMIAQGDVSDLEIMRQIITKAGNRFGEINGVIHAAGTVDYDGIIQRRTRETIKNSLAAKVLGTLVLEELLGKSNLDFLMLCSSLGNIFYKVKFGQVGYAAANEYLDAYAYHSRFAKGCHTVTINWDDWKEVGMSVDSRNRRLNGKSAEVGEAGIFNSLSSEEGVEVFNRVLHYNFRRIIVSIGHLESLREHLNSSSNDPGTNHQEQIDKHARPELATNFIAPRNKTEEQLAKIWQDLLGIEQVGIHDNFYDLGGHSLLGTQLISKLRKNFGVNLVLRSLYDNPTVATLSLLLKQSGENTAEYADKLLQALEQLDQLSEEDLRKLDAQ